jgi:hypothetical protein
MCEFFKTPYSTKGAPDGPTATSYSTGKNVSLMPLRKTRVRKKFSRKATTCSRASRSLASVHARPCCPRDQVNSTRVGVESLQMAMRKERNRLFKGSSTRATRFFEFAYLVPPPAGPSGYTYLSEGVGWASTPPVRPWKFRFQPGFNPRRVWSQRGATREVDRTYSCT